MTKQDKPLWLKADWSAPAHVHAGTSYRTGGYSSPPYNEFNLAMHVGDDGAVVEKNRNLLYRNLLLPSEPIWLEQTHSSEITFIKSGHENVKADGSITKQKNTICVVLTADCVPLLICNKDGTQVAAIHAGWKGICNGIITNALKHFAKNDSLLVWIGPCIRKENYQVGQDVYDNLLKLSINLENTFQQQDEKHWLCDLGEIVKIILRKNGVDAIYDSGLCTFQHVNQFYSYRRDGTTGRSATMIWME